MSTHKASSVHDVSCEFKQPKKITNFTLSKSRIIRLLSLKYNELDRPTLKLLSVVISHHQDIVLLDTTPLMIDASSEEIQLSQEVVTSD